MKYCMQIKINVKILTWLLVGLLVGALIPLTAFYLNTFGSKSDDAGGEGNTTIIRVYQLYTSSGGEIPLIMFGYFLDVEHRLYPDSIIVPPHSSVDLGIDYTCNIEGQGDWNVQPSGNIQLVVEVPRMPSNCSIESFLDTITDTGNREFYVIITFTNTNNEAWNVGRPLVKVLNMFLGQPSEGAGMPRVEVAIETNIS
ncbi:MAG: hypothetical protein ACQXXH_02005 [Candidatus Bathyarchaeia archaeon]|jgi:hypothetical protein|nr:hypothetical protein [Candidatus Bathyarchaeota archaeon A05DMB-4]MDH7594519.1 hypothetical protein [Candidatus Bathyarchaeota archaeon]